MRELGITTILRGFEGNVPGQLRTLYPSANISGSGESYLLDALDPLFTRLSDAYMEDLISTFGTDHYYQADGFFDNTEGPWEVKINGEKKGTPGSQTKAGVWQQDNSGADGIPPPPSDHNAFLHSQAAYGGLNRTDPKAVWVYQTWVWRSFGASDLPYLRGWLAAVPEHRLLLLDQTAEWMPLWSNFGNWSFAQRPFVWCAMLDMGGGLGMFGDMQVLNTQPLAAKQIPNSSMVGVGIDPEGIDQNPVFGALLFA